MNVLEMVPKLRNFIEIIGVTGQEYIVGSTVSNAALRSRGTKMEGYRVIIHKG